MQAAPTPFSDLDVAIHRVLRLYGKDLNWWREQSESDQIEYLAATRWQQSRIHQLQEIVKSSEYPDATAFFALLQAELE